MHAHTGAPFTLLLGHLAAPKPRGWVVRGKRWDLLSTYVPGSMLEFTWMSVFNPHDEPCQVGEDFSYFTNKKIEAQRG